MARVLILFAHPALEKSRVHRRLIREVPKLPHLTFHDLYEAYPGFDIDVRHEQRLLLEHDLIVLQHPMFWYSAPPLVKQWEDLVLEHGWAYGRAGNALLGKRMLSLISTGGGAAAYSRTGFHGSTVREFLLPIARTATLCKMEYLPPYVIHGTHSLGAAEIDAAAAQYGRLLGWLHDDQIDFAALHDAPTLNEAVERRLSSEAAI